MKNISSKRLIRDTMMLAILIVLAYVAIPTPWGVPIVLQNFVVMLIGLVLKKWDALAVVSVYLLMGAVGLPVFAGGAGGFVHLISISGGYLIAYPFVVFLIGWSMELFNKSSFSTNGGKKFIFSLFVTFLFGVLMTNFIFGAIGMTVFAQLPYKTAFVIQFGFIGVSTVKAVVAAIIYSRLPKSVLND